jgi:plastocyanin
MNTKLLNLTLAAVLAASVAGCGDKKDESTSQPAAPAPTAGKTVDQSTAGSVSGTVTLTGTAPTAKPINMSAEPYCQKSHTSPVIPPEVVTGDKGALADVVIYVKDGLVPLDQKGCMYDPHVIAVMTGQNIEVKNEDQTTHNIHPMPKDNREWNKSQPPGAAPIDDSFARAENAIPVKCNVHPWMKSYIFVFKNPYYAVTTKDGKFELKGLPPGTYTIEAWQEKYGTQDMTVTVPAKGNATAAFTFKAGSGD